MDMQFPSGMLNPKTCDEIAKKAEEKMKEGKEGEKGVMDKMEEGKSNMQEEMEKAKGGMDMNK